MNEIIRTYPKQKLLLEYPLRFNLDIINKYKALQNNIEFQNNYKKMENRNKL
jgi:hypothetical protein